MFKRASYLSIESMIFAENMPPERIHKISEEIADVLEKNGLAVANEDDLIDSLITIGHVRCFVDQVKVLKRLMKTKDIIILPKVKSHHEWHGCN